MIGKAWAGASSRGAHRLLVPASHCVPGVAVLDLTGNLITMIRTSLPSNVAKFSFMMSNKIHMFFI